MKWFAEYFLRVLMSFSHHILDCFGRSINQHIRSVRKLLLLCQLLKTWVKENLKKSICYLFQEYGLFTIIIEILYRFSVIDFSTTGEKYNQTISTHVMKTL